MAVHNVWLQYSQQYEVEIDHYEDAYAPVVVRYWGISRYFEFLHLNLLKLIFLLVDVHPFKKIAFPTNNNRWQGPITDLEVLDRRRGNIYGN